jgi:hypothetical protein
MACCRQLLLVVVVALLVGGSVQQENGTAASRQLHIAVGTGHHSGHLTPFMALAKELIRQHPDAKISLICSDVCRSTN